MYIQCTKKLLEAGKFELGEYQGSELSPFYEWHANLFVLHRRKGVLLMNNATRYGIVLYGLKATEFKRFDQIVLDSMWETFLAEGFSEEQVRKYIENCGEVRYSKTNSRSVLGYLSQFDWYMSAFIDDYLPSDSINLVGLNLACGGNYTIFKQAGKIVHPLDLLKEEMEKL